MAVPASVIMRKTVGDIGGSDSSSGPVTISGGTVKGGNNLASFIPPTIWWVQVILAVVIFLAISSLWKKA